MGFIEEQGAAQHCGDATEQTLRSMISFGITERLQVSASVPVPITTGTQPPMGRMTATMSDAPNLEAIGAQLKRAASAAAKAVDWVVPAYGTKTRVAHAGAVPYLELWGIVVGGWQLGRAALVAARQLAAGTGDAKFLSAKIHTARFYADYLLPRAAGLAHTVTEGGESALAMGAEQF